MKRLVFGVFILLLGVFIFANASFAGCWVEDGTFYSKSKYDMMTFGMAMEQKKKTEGIGDG